MAELAEKITYIGTYEEPLSADIAIIRGEKDVWIYDVGAADAAARELEQIISAEEKSASINVIISHFHADHMGNIGRVKFNKMFGGSNSVKKSKAIYGERAEFVTVDHIIEIDDGIKLRIFPIPSTHAKGCVGLEVNGEMAFVGDSLVPTFKDGKVVYNATLLHDTIKCVEAFDADKICMSHHMQEPYEKERILEILRSVYEKREQGEPYIRVGDFRKLFEMK